MSQIFTINSESSLAQIDEAASAVVNAVTSGGLAVIPTDTSYAVICDAFNPDAVALLRQAKQQPEQTPIPVGAGNRATIDGVATFSELANDLVCAIWPGALTVITKQQPSVNLAASSLEHGLSVRIPNHTLAQNILNAIGPTAMTGAQLAGQEPVTTIEAAKRALGDLVTTYVDNGTLPGTNSSVVDATGANLRLVRAGNLSLTMLRTVVPMIIDATASSQLG